MSKIVTLLLVGVATPAIGADYLTEVVSPVYTAPGSPDTLATRAATCITQNLAPGTTDAPLILSSSGGVVVANSAIERGSVLRLTTRARFTFEARDGRFRIKQTNIERFNQGRWASVGKWTGSQWRSVEDGFRQSAERIAACVSKQQDDW